MQPGDCLSSSGYRDIIPRGDYMLFSLTFLWVWDWCILALGWSCLNGKSTHCFILAKHTVDSDIVTSRDGPTVNERCDGWWSTHKAWKINCFCLNLSCKSPKGCISNVWFQVTAWATIAKEAGDRVGSGTRTKVAPAQRTTPGTSPSPWYIYAAAKDPFMDHWYFYPLSVYETCHVTF